MIIISAMGRNRVIGNGAGMPWDVPEEYQHFLDTTRGQTLIMGRKSFEIFGPTLTCRHCCVVTRRGGQLAVKRTSQSAGSEAADQLPARSWVTPVHSLAEAEARAIADGGEVYIAGGASIYKQSIHRADRMLLSYIDGEFDGDALFPEFAAVDWDVVRRERHARYELVEYVRT